MGYCDESLLNSDAIRNDESLLRSIVRYLGPGQPGWIARTDDGTETQRSGSEREGIWTHWPTVIGAAIGLGALGMSLRLSMGSAGAAASILHSWATWQAVAGIGLAALAAGQQFWLGSLQQRLREARAEAVALQQMALLDPLTSLYNRWVAQDRLPQEIARCQRLGLPLMVLCLDVNNLKIVNDTYGHLAGDAVLKAFARKIREAVRLTDVPVRLGGDEFLVLLPDCTPEQVTTILARMRGLKVQTERETIPVTFSAGWATCSGGESAERLLERADERLYREKSSTQKCGSGSRPWRLAEEAPLPSRTRSARRNGLPAKHRAL